MLKVASRLELGPSAKAYNEVYSELRSGMMQQEINQLFQPLSDDLAMARAQNESLPIVIKAEKAITLFMTYKTGAANRERTAKPTVFGNKTYFDCRTINESRDVFINVGGVLPKSSIDCGWPYAASMDDANNSDREMLQFIGSFLRLAVAEENTSTK